MEHFMPQATPIIDKAIHVMWWVLASLVALVGLVVLILY